MADVPIVSIIICSRNRAAGLGQTIITLNQIATKHAWEALLVDNASTDGTADVMQAAARANPHIRTLLCPRIGLGAAREFARIHSTGRILAFTDDDCLMAPDYIDQLVQAFARHPDAGVIGGWIGLFNPDHLAVTIDERTEVVRHAPHSFVPTGSFHGANLAFRAAALDRAGGFDPWLGAGTPFPCEDIDAVARVVTSGLTAVYDPQVRVLHDHGRVEADRAGIMDGYDRGRGAYYAKCLAAVETRQACFRFWSSIASRATYRADLAIPFREARYAWRFAQARLAPAHRIVVGWHTTRVISGALFAVIRSTIARRLGAVPERPIK